MSVAFVFLFLHKSHNPHLALVQVYNLCECSELPMQHGFILGEKKVGVMCCLSLKLVTFRGFDFLVSAWWWGSKLFLQIVSKDLSDPVRSHKDLDKDAAPYFKKAVKFYENLANQLISQGHVLDLFASALDQVCVSRLLLSVLISIILWFILFMFLTNQPLIIAFSFWSFH